MGRAASIQRLNAVRGSLPHMSQSALAAFLAKAQDEDLPAVRQTREVREARDAVGLQDTPYGKLNIRADVEQRLGRMVSMDTVNPHAVLYASA